MRRFPDEEEDELSEAIAELELELEYENSVRSLHAIGRKPALRRTIDLFVHFDKPAIGSDPFTDEAERTQRILASDNDAVEMPQLHAEAGWTLRHFNPAIGMVIAEMDCKSVGQVIRTSPRSGTRLRP